MSQIVVGFVFGVISGAALGFLIRGWLSEWLVWRQHE